MSCVIKQFVSYALELFGLADGPGRPLRFAAHRQPLCWNFMYHSRIVLSVGDSVRYMIRNLRCTVTIDSVLANSKTQNAFLFTVHAIFHHNYPLAVEPTSTPRPLVPKKLWEILYLLIWSFLPCMSWLLRNWVRKFRRDLWITLYNLVMCCIIYFAWKWDNFATCFTVKPCKARVVRDVMEFWKHPLLYMYECSNEIFVFFFFFFFVFSVNTCLTHCHLIYCPHCSVMA